MTNFPVLGKAELDSDQCRLWDELTLGPRGFYTGGAEAKRLPELYNAWLQFPQFGQHMLGIAEQLRNQTELSGKYRELIVLTTSSLLEARVEYEFHIPFARNEGLIDEVIEAIGAGSEPPFSDAGERLVYEANVALVKTSTLDSETRQALVELIGHRGLMQFIAGITLYTAVAYTTNVAGVQLADDFSADPDQLKDFFANTTTDSNL